MTIVTEDLGFWGTRLAAKIPKEITEKLYLREGDKLIFVHDEGKNYAIIGTRNMLKFKDKNLKQLAPGALGIFNSDLTEEDIDLILKELTKKDE